MTKLNLDGDEKIRNEKEKKDMKMKKWIGNKIGYEGAKTISESLKINTSLTKLNLKGDKKIRNENEKMKWKNE